MEPASKDNPCATIEEFYQRATRFPASRVYYRESGLNIGIVRGMSCTETTDEKGRAVAQVAFSKKMLGYTKTKDESTRIVDPSTVVQERTENGRILKFNNDGEYFIEVESFAVRCFNKLMS